MEAKIKKIGVSDLNKLAIILDEDFINEYNICDKDRLIIDEEQFLKEER